VEVRLIVSDACLGLIEASGEVLVPQRLLVCAACGRLRWCSRRSTRSRAGRLRKLRLLRMVQGESTDLEKQTLDTTSPVEYGFGVDLALSESISSDSPKQSAWVSP
jgi:hypothetical protein